MLSGRSIFHWLAPAAPAVDEPLLKRSLDVLLDRSALEEVPEDVLERSAEVLVPAPDVERSAVAEPVPVFELLLERAGLPALLEEELRSVLLELEVPDALGELPVPDVELASLRGEELLLKPMPLLEPLPVLLPDAPAPLEPDSRISDTVTSGVPCEAGKVTIATPNPFSILPEEVLLRPPEVDDEPLRPPLEVLERSALDEEVELRSVLLDDEEELRSAPEVEEDDPIPLLLLRSAPVDEDDEPIPLLFRSVEEDEDDPIPPLLDEDEPAAPLVLPELLSDRRLLLPEPPLVLLDLPEEFTGQLDISAGLETSPCTMVRSLKESVSAVASGWKSF